MSVHTPFTYKTHLLVGQYANTHATIVARWEHVPTQKEIEEVRLKNATNYVAFVLVNVVGEEYKGDAPASEDPYCYG